MAPQQSSFKAALWMAGSITSFLVMSIAGRETTAKLDVFQVLEMRSVIGFFILLPLVFLTGGFPAMRTKRPLQHIGRNVAHYAGQAAWLYALTLIPLGELVSIEFTTPIWTALLAVFFLGEKLSRARIAAIVLGLVGIIVIVRPGVGAAETGHLDRARRRLRLRHFTGHGEIADPQRQRREIIFWMLVIQSAIGLYPAILGWKNPPAELWPWIFVIAFTGMSSHFCLARALVHADATFISPMDFLRVPLSALIGWMLYSEQIDFFTAGGALLILAGNLLNLQGRPKKPLEIEIETS